MQSSIKKLLDQDIAVTAKIVSPLEAASCPPELMVMEFLIADAKLAGVKLYPVTWDDGVVALVAGDPADIPAWQRALIKTHELGVAGVLGPVDMGGGK